MQLKLIGKRLITSPLCDKIIQGEDNADIVSISLPKSYGELDLTGFSFKMRAVSEDGTVAEQVLSKNETDNALTLVWTITSDFTSVSGPMKLLLIGISSDEETTIKFRGQDITIIPEINGTTQPTADVVAQAIAQMQLEVQSAIDAAERAEAAEGKTAYDIAVDNGYTGTKAEWLISLKGTDGTSVNPLRVYSTLQELQAAYPDGSSLNGGFMVGTHYYFWSIDGEWTDIGEIKGTDGLTTSVNDIEQVSGNIHLDLDDIPDGTSRKLSGLTVDANGIITRTIEGVAEYLNPPMTMGTEYCTTERFEGKPVYVKLVNFGTLPNSASKSVQYTPTSASRFAPIVAYGCTVDGALIPSSGAVEIKVYCNNVSIFVTTSSDLSSKTAHIAVKYTKIIE